MAREGRLLAIRQVFGNDRGPHMSELLFLVEEAVEGGFNARALGESIFTHAASWEELNERVREATLCHFEEGKAPRIIRLHYVRDEVIAL